MTEEDIAPFAFAALALMAAIGFWLIVCGDYI